MASPQENPNNGRRPPPGTPPRPPYSPVTPVMAYSTILPPPPPDSPLELSSTSLAAMSQLQSAQDRSQRLSQRGPVFAPEPAPVPISESDNPDAIALRSAITILQMQRQKALRDIRTLDDLKKEAAHDPEGFSRELAAGKLKSGTRTGDILRSGTTLPVGSQQQEDGEAQDESSRSTFGKIPEPQNIVRMPAINWTKYHVVGDALDRLHEDQKRRPTPGEPRRDAPTPTPPPTRSEEHFVAAPYRPFIDKLEPRTPARNPSEPKYDQTQ